MKKMWRHALLGMMAVAMVVTLPFTSALAQKTTPATDKNTAVPAVPRAIPDLIPYHKFDPPKSKQFDISKLTISGDLRVRPEYRNAGNFAVNGTSAAKGSNAFFVQQWVRLGFNYDISPDVAFFAQPQWSKNWGREIGGAGDPNSTTELFMRQAFMLVRNFGVQDLTLKGGRQLTVWGNHRIFGHFDWNNVGWAFDGLTFRYNHEQFPVEVGWLRIREGNCGGPNTGGCPPGAGGSSTSASNGDSDIILTRGHLKFAGVKIEPAWIFESGGTGAGLHIARPVNQRRHTLGGRATTKMNMLDATIEGYYQTGEVGDATGPKAADINAYAFHADGGFTLFNNPMQPRLGLEFNYASGDGSADNGSCGDGSTPIQTACGSNIGTFSQLWPTNHIHFGYMDNQAWKNMKHLAATLQLRPTKASHFEVAGHGFWRADDSDHLYGANQNIKTASTTTNNADYVGSELDVVYTLFFQGNKVAWQAGYGHYFAGDFLDNACGVGCSASDQEWAYTQLWINF